jgi:hypothetical protein
MKDSTRILFAVGAIFPYLSVLLSLLILGIPFFIFLATEDGSYVKITSLMLSKVVLPLYLITILVFAVTMLLYIINVFRNDRIGEDKKITWAFVLLIGNLILMPAYWYLYIRGNGQKLLSPVAKPNNSFNPSPR